MAVKLPTYELTPLLPLESNGWRYRETAEPLPAGWATQPHAADGTQWLTGQSPIGLGTQYANTANQLLDVPGLTGPAFYTYYFEHEFEFNGSNLPYDFQLNHFIDGGAVFYINGVELADRFNMPDGAISGTTPASAVLRTRDVGLSDAISIPADLLVEGTNRLSVELHRPDLGFTNMRIVFDTTVALREEVKPGEPAKPFVESDEEWIELYNRGTGAVDISGWQLSDAVDYRFEAATVIQPGQYLVVANDAKTLSAKYPNIQIVGDFGGTLGNHDDRIRLLDANKNPADEVHYYESGRWDSVADGGGSSLELRNPNADNNKAEVWAPSDETAEVPVADLHVSQGGAGGSIRRIEPTYNEFIFGLLDSGEFLIDDIRVVQDPDGVAKELLQNGTFEGDTLGGPAASGGSSARIRARSSSTPTIRRIRSSTSWPPDRTPIPTTTPKRRLPTERRRRTATSTRFTFRAKWLGGSSQLNTRLFFTRAALHHESGSPGPTGTPGVQNSTFEANVGPHLRHLSTCSHPARGKSGGDGDGPGPGPGRCRVGQLVVEIEGWSLEPSGRWRPCKTVPGSGTIPGQREGIGGPVLRGGP